ncbi:ECF subfamily RNA polymerase sigma factor [Fulvitalea axinellae]|uniref:ECF subfamily RNA polymerase sigma factor n=1 Tax=Fulvitalea axinellae TaxID=1182444 RepID=A0AAU9DDV1_9BACT|nr:ECF subfamily RNA polymerase sigma factor [Fulvitalea axinellae]
MLSTTFNKEEEQIIEQAKKDPAHFRELYEKYFGKIFNFIHRKVYDEHLAADITSQVFLSALNSLHKYEHRGFPFSAWLYRIALNEVRQHFRDKKKQMYVFLDEQTLGNLEKDVDLWFDPEDPKDRNILQAAVSGLNEKDAYLLELRFQQELNYRDIGEVLGTNENNIKQRAHRLYKKLRKACETAQSKYA